ncbi:hypothetical protein L6164_017551 [Bauhinia variegata]|uniref:Uncharacterized protein n=1 Tax=Bauhinia variegata TaxID=167791 RepID=A0ACB9N8V7_BAUVA|nr:hypothetical protein L6164_017551 [Bauhinia variegata]
MSQVQATSGRKPGLIARLVVHLVNLNFAGLCLGAWSDHGERTGGFYACNRYEAAKQEGVYDEAERRREMEKIPWRDILVIMSNGPVINLHGPPTYSSRQKALADPHQMQTMHREAWLQDFRQNGDDAIVDIEVRTGGARIGDYEYLLSMPMGTLTIESVEKLLAQKEENLDSKGTEEERRRLSEAKKRATSRGVTLAAKRPPRKNSKKANNVLSEAYIVANSSMDRKLQRLSNGKVGLAVGKAPPKKDDEEGQSLQNKEYNTVKSLRYSHLMIMTDQDYDGSHIKGLLINFVHSFWPPLPKVPSFLVEFTTPIIKGLLGQVLDRKGENTPATLSQMLI